MTAKLTENEKLVLVELFKSSKGNGHDFGFSNEVKVKGLAPKAVNALIGSLQKKGILDTEGSRVNGYIQFVFCLDSEIREDHDKMNAWLAETIK